MNQTSDKKPLPGGPRFSLGQIVGTPGALSAIITDGDSPFTFLNRHQNGDWGDLVEEDRRANDRAIQHEDQPDRRDRVFSAYHTSKGTKLWVITEHDRSVTTILLPEEY